MGEKRQSRRLPFRKRIRLGKTDATFMGYTSNISERGLQIESRNTYPPGTKIVITFPGEKVQGKKQSEIRVEGTVKWSKLSLGSLSGRMGLEFVENADDRIKQIYKERLNILTKS